MLTWKALHVLAMFLTAVFFDGPTFAFWWAVRRRDLAMLRGVQAMVKRSDMLGGISLVAGIGFGIATGLAGGIDFTAPWLILAYVMLGIVILTGAVLFPMWYARIEKAAEESGNAFSPQLEVLLRDPRTVALAILPAGLFLAIIYVMVAKPI